MPQTRSQITSHTRQSSISRLQISQVPTSPSSSSNRISRRRKQIPRSLKNVGTRSTSGIQRAVSDSPIRASPMASPTAFPNGIAAYRRILESLALTAEQRNSETGVVAKWGPADDSRSFKHLGTQPPRFESKEQVCMSPISPTAFGFRSIPERRWSQNEIGEERNFRPSEEAFVNNEVESLKNNVTNLLQRTRKDQEVRKLVADTLRDLAQDFDKAKT
jgi:hypothetical protein